MSEIRTDVREWFDTHTFRSATFNAQALVDAKHGQKISVILPARDEADTIGGIVSAIRAELIEAHQLVDEILVIDSHSSDDTALIAQSAGATVFHVDDILAEAGSNTGKGEAMWKALAVMTGDIGLYLDADVLDFSTEFVTGLLGPLLMDSSITFAKGFYDRPWNSPGVDQPTGGGRVTELVARPLILDRAPLLAAFVQPLAGECAFRREALLDVPFVSGYGVDIGLMVDVVNQFGLASMAQVDLGVRKHSHQGLAALSAMAREVHSAVALRCPSSQLDSASGAVVEFSRGAEFDMTMTSRTVVTTQRPPMRSQLALTLPRSGDSPQE